MIFAQILHSIFFLILGNILYLKYNNGKVKSTYFFTLIPFLLVLFLINYFFNGLSNRLLFVILMFSLSIVILQLMKNSANVIESNRPLEKNKQLRENVLKIKNFTINKVMIVMICMYQQLLIWTPEIYNSMIE